MSQTESHSEKEEINYQLGVEDLDMSGSIADDEDVMKFQYESEAIFKRLAEDIYESAEAGLREPLTNSITTSRRVIREGQCSNPVIEITVKDGDQQKLRLRDMGEGISKSLLEEVLLYIGRSTARDDGELSGQYGMGFLASYTLVGMNGGFVMHTNSRSSSEGPYTGLFKPGAFEPDNEGKIPSLLDKDEYGTVFEYFLKPEISIRDVRGWVDRHARYSPIPIIYKELDENGTEQYNEDYYAPTLKKAYGEAPCLRVDTPYYEATTSPEANNDVILISSPVNMYGTRALRSGLPWSVDLRLKFENGLVVKGPHEGLIPVSDKQYEMMDDERKKKHVSKEQLTDDDLTLPEATGTRERVRRHKKFLQHVNDQLREQFLEVVEETLDDFNPSEGMTNVDDMQRNVFMRIFNHFDSDDEYTQDDVESKLDSEYNYENPDEELIEFILAMTQEVSIISDMKTRKSRYPRKMAYKVAEDDSEVYMCVSSNSWKADAVEISSKETDVVKVNKASDYELFEKHLGWSPLKNIKKSNADELLGLTEEQIEDITYSSKTTEDNIDKKKLTVHYESGGRNTLKRTSDSLIDRYKEVNIGKRTNRYGDVLVLFPHMGEHKVSDHYHLANNRCCVASVTTKKMTNYLTENAEGIMTYEEYNKWVKSQKVVTSKGMKSVEMLVEGKSHVSPLGEIVLTPKNNPEHEVVNTTTILSAIAEQIKEKYTAFDYTPVYGIVNKTLLEHIESVYDMEDTDSIHLLSTSVNYRPNHRYASKKYENEVKLYAKACLTEEQYDTNEIKNVISMFDTLNESSVNMIEKLVQSHENEGSFASENKKEDVVRMPTVKTKYGEMPFDEVSNYVDYRNVVLHIVEDTEILYKFEQDSIINNAGEQIKTMEDICDVDSTASEILYVPMLKSEYQRVSTHIPDDVTTLNIRYNRSTNYNIYANTKLPRWSDSSMIQNLKSKCKFIPFTEFVDTLAPIHDEGVDIEEENYSAKNVAKKLL